MVKAKRAGKTKVCVNVTYRRAGQNKKRKLWCRITVKAEKPVRTGKPVGSGGPETTAASQISLASMLPVSAAPETTESVERRNPPAEAPVISMPSGTLTASAAGNEPYLEADSTGCYTKGKTQAVFLLRSATMPLKTAENYGRFPVRIVC